MDYKASLKEWMSQHMLSSLDVRDILNQMREDDRAVKSTSDLSDVDESMDGDFDSAMASAGHGTDEDYGYFGDPEICGE
jgi:hypothetical protein